MVMMFPFQVGPLGGIAEIRPSDHAIQAIKQVLMTSIGERINRPDFGTTINQALFRSAQDLEGEQQFSLQAALQQWLGHLIKILSVTLSQENTTLKIEVQYVSNETEEKKKLKFNILNL